MSTNAMDANAQQALLNLLARANQEQQQQITAQTQIQRQQQSRELSRQIAAALASFTATQLVQPTQQLGYFGTDYSSAASAAAAAPQQQIAFANPAVVQSTVNSPSVFLPNPMLATTDLTTYYQAILNQTIPAATACLCGCPALCPLHESGQSAAMIQPQPTRSSSLLGNPVRQIVVPQTPAVVPSTSLGRLLQVNQAQNASLAYLQRQRQLQTQQAQPQIPTVAMPSSSSTQQSQQQQQQLHHQQPQQQPPQQLPRDSHLRQKRPASYGTDGRPSSKVRRVLSVDGSTPSSSQILPDVSATRPEFNFNNLLAENPFRSCGLCRNRYTSELLPSLLCQCHHSNTCPYAGTICQVCYFTNYASANQAQIINPVQQQTINNRQMHQQRQREASNHFYNQNFYENPSLNAGADPIVVVNNRPPYMNILLWNSDTTITAISALPGMPAPYNQQTAQHHLQTLHQVLSQNPHIADPPPIGATVDQIKKNTTLLSYTKDPNVPEQETERCTVCLVDLETGDEVRNLNCSHVFHTECIDRWLVYNKKCPVCRLPIDSAGFQNDMIEPNDLLDASIEAVAAGL